jgi:prepilin-type N-terminal cleavage/methylation domain-containing protein
MKRTRSFNHRGFTLLELLVVVGLMGVVLGYFRLSGDARSASNAIALSKMRAASTFGRVRLFVDLDGRSFRMQAWDKATSQWTTEGGSTRLSPNVSFGYGAVSSAPPNTQGTIGQAPACKNDAGTADIGNSACVIFNSRGAPIDSTGAPTVNALYVTDGSTVYGIAVSATGMIRSWRTVSTSTASWTLQ